MTEDLRCLPVRRLYEDNEADDVQEVLAQLEAEDEQVPTSFLHTRPCTPPPAPYIQATT